VTKETIERLIHEAADSLGYEVYESSIQLKGENTRISVKIDKPGSVSHHDCEEYSRVLSGMIDETKPIPNFSLEISSPGFKRKLRNIGEFRRFIGSPAKIVYDEKGEGRVVKGTIKDVKDDFIEVIGERGEISISFNLITKANLDY
jgi:ribosome maturation factor RimP